MRNSFRFVLTALLFALLNLPVLAIDWGGALSNYTRYKGVNSGDLKLDQLDDANIWFKVPFDKAGNIYFVAEGLYEFEYDDRSDDKTHYVDLSLAKFSYLNKISATDSILVNAGRFSFSDATGVIFNQAADGLFAKYQTTMIEANVYAAYTGLLNAGIVKFLNHGKDLFEYDSDKIYQRADEYVVGAAAVTFPNFVMNQTGTLQFFGSQKTDSVKFRRLYGTLALNGPVFMGLYYNLSGTYSYAKYEDDDAVYSYLARGRLDYYFPFMGAVLSGGVDMASGDDPKKHHDDKRGAFMGFTKINAYFSADDPQYSGLFKLYTKASAKVVDKVRVSGGVDWVSEIAHRMEYKGTAFSAGVDVQAFSDLLIGAEFKNYRDYDDAKNNKMQFGINVQLVF